jgi:gentisate 1,2-dioxygenase
VLSEKRQVDAMLSTQPFTLVPIERGGERRVIASMNPGLGGTWAATSRLWAGALILLASETASDQQTIIGEFRP